MADIASHSLSWTKQDINQNFVTPTFAGVDITQIMTVITDVTGTYTMNYMSTPSNITRSASSAGFSAQGTMTLTNVDVTVAQVKAEWEQNGKAFIDSIYSEALSKGYTLDDVDTMSNPDFWNGIVLPIIIRVVKTDKVKHTWFAGAKTEVMSGTVPASAPTGVANTGLNFYTGFWDRITTDVTATTIPAAQKVLITNTGTAKIWAITLSATTAGTITLTINGTPYSQPYSASVAATVTAWYASHNATIIARHPDILKLTIVDDASAKLTFTATHKGASFTGVATDAGTSGTWTENTLTAAAAQAAMGSGTADGFMNSMIEAQPAEMQEFTDDMIFLCTRSFYRNYLNELKGVVLESAFMLMQDGTKTLSYEGIPLVQRNDWDKYITSEFNSVYKHRCILTTPENLIYVTDGANDDDKIETWYNKDDQMRRYRVEYMANTTYKHSNLIVVAY